MQVGKSSGCTSAPLTPPAHLVGAQGVAAGIQRGPGSPQAFLDR